MAVARSAKSPIAIGIEIVLRPTSNLSFVVVATCRDVKKLVICAPRDPPFRHPIRDGYTSHCRARWSIVENTYREMRLNQTLIVPSSRVDPRYAILVGRAV